MKRSRNPAGSRAAILEAAGHAFAEYGFSGARTDSIAKAARVNKALLYYYFPSKAALYAAVLREELTGFHQTALEILTREGPAASILFEYLTRHFDFVAAHPHYPRLFQRMMLAAGERPDPQLADRLSPVAEALGGLLHRGIRSGEFRALDPRHTAISLVALTVFYFNAAPIIRMISGQDPFSPRNLRRRKAEVLAFVRHAVLSKAEEAP